MIPQISRAETPLFTPLLIVSRADNTLIDQHSKDIISYWSRFDLIQQWIALAAKKSNLIAHLLQPKQRHHLTSLFDKTLTEKPANINDWAYIFRCLIIPFYTLLSKNKYAVAIAYPLYAKFFQQFIMAQWPNFITSTDLQAQKIGHYFFYILVNMFYGLQKQAPTLFQTLDTHELYVIFDFVIDNHAKAISQIKEGSFIISNQFGQQSYQMTPALIVLKLLLADELLGSYSCEPERYQRLVKLLSLIPSNIINSNDNPKEKERSQLVCNALLANPHVFNESQTISTILQKVRDDFTLSEQAIANLAGFPQSTLSPEPTLPAVQALDSRRSFFNTAYQGKSILWWLFYHQQRDVILDLVKSGMVTFKDIKKVLQSSQTHEQKTAGWWLEVETPQTTPLLTFFANSSGAQLIDEPLIALTKISQAAGWRYNRWESCYQCCVEELEQAWAVKAKLSALGFDDIIIMPAPLPIVHCPSLNIDYLLTLATLESEDAPTFEVSPVYCNFQ